MIATISNTEATRLPREAEATEIIGIHELVRGCDRRLVDHLAAYVRRQSLALDFHSVERIDAAGIAALITLYCDARQAGHRFSVFNASPRVVEVLCLVGLDRILLSRNALGGSYSDAYLDRPAA
jgi:anti-anti-sigma regulatory factor